MYSVLIKTIQLFQEQMFFNPLTKFMICKGLCTDKLGMKFFCTVNFIDKSMVCRAFAKIFSDCRLNMDY